MIFPENDNGTTPAFFSAYLKGRIAFRERGDLAECPYLETRGGRYRHVITFSRAFKRYWSEGFQDQKTGAPVRYELRRNRREKQTGGRPGVENG